MICKVYFVFFTTLVAVVATVTAGGGYGHGGGIGHGHGGFGHGGGYGNEIYKPAQYSFKYGVQDPYKGQNFGHEEHRDGYNTKGSYYVNLPDGRLQKVLYTADKYGYKAQVLYDGVAHHPKGYGHGHGGHH